MINSILKVVRGIVKIRGDDGTIADVVTRGDGKKAIAVDGSFTAEIDELLGQDNFPDSNFTITAAPTTSDSIRVQISDLSIDVTITATATENGDADKMATLVVTTLNADSTFNTSFEATKVLDNPIIHIGSIIWAEAGQHNDVNDLTVTTPVAVTVAVSVFDTKILIRKKVVSLGRDARDRRVGILAISGDVRTKAGTVDEVMVDFAKNAGSSDLLVDGSSTAVTFTFNADADDDLTLTSIRMLATSNGTIKFAQFLSKNTTLTNGVEIKITANSKVLTLPLIKNTEDFRNLFALERGIFDLQQLPSGNNLVADFFPLGSAVLKAGSSDKIEIKIQDDLSTGVASNYECLISAFKG